MATYKPYILLERVYVYLRRNISEQEDVSCQFTFTRTHLEA